MSVWSVFSAVAIAAAPAAAGPASLPNKAAVDAQCKAGQSAPSGKVSEWTGGLHEGKAGLTPAAVPGATRVTVDEMMCLDKAYGGRLVGLTPIDAGESGIPGTWRIDRGWEAGDFKDDAQAVVKRQLHYTVGTDLDRPFVVYCHNTSCFMSYNLALRAAMLGYRNIYWLRGGIEEWQGKDGKLSPLPSAITAVGNATNNQMACLIYSTVLAEMKLISEKQYNSYATGLVDKLEAALPQPTRGELFSDHKSMMEDNLAEALEEYAEVLKINAKEAATFRRENFGAYDKLCASLPGAGKGMFPS
jgi:rhodanese-related sulfurtransferase